MSTLPLPVLAALTTDLPDELCSAAQRLRHMRVVTLAYAIEGPRPEARGQWEYFARPDVCFNRLIYMHRFDPLTAPPEGWGVMAEITEAADGPPADRTALLARALADMKRVGAIGDDSEIVGEHVIEVEHGYCVFDADRADAVAALAAYYRRHGLDLLGRYGRWEYSSMAQTIEQGLAWGRSHMTSAPPGSASRAVA